MRRPRGLRIALACSLALHLGLLWWLWLLPPPARQPPPPPPRSHPVEVHVVTQSPARPTPSPQPAPPPRGPKTRTRGGAPSKTNPSTREHTEPPAPAPTPLASDVPRAEKNPERPSLLPSADSLALQPQGTLPVLPPEEPGPPGTRLRAPSRPASPQELVDGIARDSLAKSRTESGLTPTYFSDVGKTLLKRFRRTQEDAEREQKLGEKVVEKARDVSSVLSRSAELEDPIANPRRVDPLASAASLHPVVEESMKNLAYSLPQDWTRSAGTVVLRLTQASSGRVLSVELIGSSGNRGLDQAAVMAIQALGEELPPPPPDVLKGRDAVVSDWKFELLRIVAGPAALGLGLVSSFDIGGGAPEARPSFGARSEVRVTLVAYY